jgi:hypothetical protein
VTGPDLTPDQRAGADRIHAAPGAAATTKLREPAELLAAADMQGLGGAAADGRMTAVAMVYISGVMG